MPIFSGIKFPIIIAVGKLKKYCLIIANLYGLNVFCQFSDSLQYYIGGTSSGSYNRTNTNSNFLLNNSLKLSAKKKELRYNLSNKWLYGKQDEQLTNNDFMSSLDVNLYKTFPHFYYWGLLNYNSSFSLKVNSQLQAGLGVAYNIIDRSKITFNLSDGIIYDYSNIILEDNKTEIYGTFRNSARIQLKWNANNRFTFNGIGFLQNSLAEKDDYIIRSDVNLGYNIKKWLSLTVGFTYNEISRAKTQNLFVTYGIVVEKYF